MAGAVERRLGSALPGHLCAGGPLGQARLTFLCTTSCQLMLRKNLCSMTSFASLGPPPSLGRDKHHLPPSTQPHNGRFWEPHTGLISTRKEVTG